MPSQEITCLDAALRFIGIASSSEWIELSPWSENRPQDLRDLWKVQLKTPFAKRTVEFSMGTGHNGSEPEPSDILESLLSDASFASFDLEEFCEELSYSMDSASERQSAKRAWLGCKSSAKKLDALLGPLAEPVKNRDARALFLAALGAAQDRPALAKPAPQRGKWGLMALAAFSAHPESIAAATLQGRTVSEEGGIDLIELCSSREEQFGHSDDEELEDDAKASIRALLEREALLADTPSKAPSRSSSKKASSAL